MKKQIHFPQVDRAFITLAEQEIFQNGKKIDDARSADVWPTYLRKLHECNVRYVGVKFGQCIHSIGPIEQGAELDFVFVVGNELSVIPEDVVKADVPSPMEIRGAISMLKSESVSN